MKILEISLVGNESRSWRRRINKLGKSRWLATGHLLLLRLEIVISLRFNFETRMRQILNWCTSKKEKSFVNTNTINRARILFSVSAVSSNLAQYFPALTTDWRQSIMVFFFSLIYPLFAKRRAYFALLNGYSINSSCTVQLAYLVQSLENNTTERGRMKKSPTRNYATVRSRKIRSWMHWSETRDYIVEEVIIL